MPRYRAKHDLLIADRYIEPGQEFMSDIEPGRNWEPLDAAASAAVAAMLLVRGGALEKAAATGIDPQRLPAGLVEIPDDWPLLPPQKRRFLALKLGAQLTCTAADAESFIQAELARRAQLAA